PSFQTNFFHPLQPLQVPSFRNQLPPSVNPISNRWQPVKYHRRRQLLPYPVQSIDFNYPSINNVPITLTNDVELNQRLSANLLKLSRIKLLNQSNLKCIDYIDSSNSYSLVNLNSSNTYCTYNDFCPQKCSCCTFEACDCRLLCPLNCNCIHSTDWIYNAVNCSSKTLSQIPYFIPLTVTNLYLDNNQIVTIPSSSNQTHKKNTLNHLKYLKNLSLKNNLIEKLNGQEFFSMENLEYLDLSSNKLDSINEKTFSYLTNLKSLSLYKNYWQPKFYSSINYFQSNVKLRTLSYGKNNDLIYYCNRTYDTLTMTIIIDGDYCCKNNFYSESCKKPHDQHLISGENLKNYDQNDSTIYSNRFLSILFDKKYRYYFIIGGSIFLFLIFCMIIICIICIVCCRQKRHQSTKIKTRTTVAKKLINSQINNNHYHKPSTTSTQPTNQTAIQKLLLSTKQKVAYEQQENDASFSDENENESQQYASIPLSVSNTNLDIKQIQQPQCPPLPPPRHSNRPVLHSSSAIQTSIRSINPPVQQRTSLLKRNSSINSNKSTILQQNFMTRSCLTIKLDALILYSIGDSEYVHNHIGKTLEDIYCKRFSFYFLHRDRMIGDLEWLINNSCVIIIIIKKPYNTINDYMKILTTSPLKRFVILIDNNGNRTSKTSSSLSLLQKKEEKIARLYKTQEVYEWCDPDLHEKLEIFLENNCGSATYVPC
ncbi:unnamed protein product, partial [Didymodactylos carnosus]